MNCERYSKDEIIILVGALYEKAYAVGTAAYDPGDYRWEIGSGVAKRLGSLPPMADEKMTLYGIDVEIDHVNPWSVELWKKVKI